MKSLSKFFWAAVAACFLAAVSFAAGEAASPAGTWQWTQQSRQAGGASFERKAKLDYKDGKLTGEMLPGEGPRGATPAAPIKEASFKDGVVMFSITREFSGNSYTVKYEGKLEGDTIKGTASFPNPEGGEPTKREWTATRAK